MEKFKAEKGTTNWSDSVPKIVSKGGSNTLWNRRSVRLLQFYPKHFITGADGKIVYGSNTAETKTALEEIRKLVESGVIDSSL